MGGVAAFVVLAPLARFARDNIALIVVLVIGVVVAVVLALVLRRRHLRRRVERDQDRLRAVLPFHNMNDKQFEHALASLCRASGCREVEVSGGSGGHGADVKALTPDGRRLILQAKRYNIRRAVGEKRCSSWRVACSPGTSSTSPCWSRPRRSRSRPARPPRATGSAWLTTRPSRHGILVPVPLRGSDRTTDSSRSVGRHRSRGVVRS
ncbi:restriction endonuclease [Nocardia transvalensis]|nr:restriction endonuclease [Nocardia transvalensis]